uniref:NOP2/Sun RNA methyltransferase 6 n=1 Tax=Lates calcarifer TaxID=8187 RepID=A0A4W6FJM8_LATCA
MSIFPRISLRPEVTEYLKNVFLNKEVLAAVGQQEAESRFHKLLICLSHPPSYTCVRASTHLASLEEIRHKLGEELKKQMCSSSAEEFSPQILPHPQIPDVLLLPVHGPRYVKNAGTMSDKSLSALLCGVHT